MAVESGQRRDERRLRLEAVLGAQHVEAALDLLAMADMAWHDRYGPSELDIPSDVVEDILLLCRGDLCRPHSGGPGRHHRLPRCSGCCRPGAWYRHPHRRLAPGPRGGLGLSLVASIVTAHGGTITATARPQGGLDLLVAFPLAG